MLVTKSQHRLAETGTERQAQGATEGHEGGSRGRAWACAHSAEMHEVTQPVIKTRVLQRTDTAEQTDRNQRLLPRAWGGARGKTSHSPWR